MTVITESNYKREVASSYCKKIFLGLVLIVIATITAKCFNWYYPLPEICKNLFEDLGYLCWVISLSEGGLTLISWRGRSPAELLNQNLAKICSLIGVFAFVFSRELVIF